MDPFVGRLGSQGHEQQLSVATHSIWEDLYHRSGGDKSLEEQVAFHLTNLMKKRAEEGFFSTLTNYQVFSY